MGTPWPRDVRRTVAVDATSSAVSVAPSTSTAVRPPQWRLVVAAGLVATLVGTGSYAAATALPGGSADRAFHNAHRLLAVEQRLGIDIEQAVQHSVLGRGAIGTGLAIFYAAAYWPFVVGTVALTAWRDRAGFRLVRNALLISGAVGLAVMALHPVAPPRLLERFDDQVASLGPLATVAHPDGLFNPYAAMPSFHVCWTIVAALGLQRLVRGPQRWVCPTLMAVAVVTTGNHYVLDVVGGAVLAVVAWRLATPMQQALVTAPVRVRTEPAAGLPSGDGERHMILSPRYEGPPVLTIEDDGSDTVAAITRQHQRLTATLASLDATGWATPSRCDGWSARDVAAHLIGVNSFWAASIGAGVAGRPTTILAGFDPAATPPLMVGSMAALSDHEVLEQFTSTSRNLLATLAGLDDAGWAARAESPAGHVPIGLLAQHALWDSWVHERDIALPLGLDVPVDADELTICLRYAAAISPVLGFGVGRTSAGRFAVDATDPDIRFVVEVGESVAVHHAASLDGLPCLRGDALAVTEGLSLRAPLPPDAPDAWALLLGGLRTAFDAT